MLASLLIFDYTFQRVLLKSSDLQSVEIPTVSTVYNENVHARLLEVLGNPQDVFESDIKLYKYERVTLIPGKVWSQEAYYVRVSDNLIVDGMQWFDISDYHELLDMENGMDVAFSIHQFLSTVKKGST